MNSSEGIQSQYQKKNIVDYFFQLELKHDLLNIETHDIFVWERIRWRALRKVLNKADIINQPHQYEDGNWKNYFKAGRQILKNIALHNPYVVNEHNVVFFGHPRRKLLDDGHWWDLYCDPIQDNISHDALHIEGPQKFQHKKPPKTDNILYLDYLKYTAAMKRKAGIIDIQLDNKIKKSINEFENDLYTKFDICVEFEPLIKYELDKHFSEKPLYHKLLHRTNPEVVIVVPGYGSETLLSACSKANITTIELQHGIIHPEHLGYSYPGPRKKEVFPDYLFVWGDFWSENIEYPIPNERVISVGYPYFSQQVGKFSDIETKDVILFISQGTIGEDLSKFALKISENCQIDSEVIYKLHPSESDQWKRKYPWLVDSDITVIASSTPPLYELFAKAHTQIGVGSTALYEGLAFGLETYVYDLPGKQALSALIEQDIAKLISSEAELININKKYARSFDKEHFFCSDPISNFERELNKIMGA